MRAFIIVLLLLVSFAAPILAAEKGERKVLYWYDPMVPEQKFEHGGKSPFMDMDLVPFYEDEAKGGQSGEQGKVPDNAVYIDARYRQALGVKGALVEMHEFGNAVHAYGHIDHSPRREYEMTTRTAGWIVDFPINSVGDQVKKGDLVYTLYSPDLMQAQSDYLIGRRVGDAERRLRLYGMDEQAVAQMIRQGKFLEATPFHAPADGTVATVDVHKGGYVNEGDTILTVHDYSQLWIIVHVPPRDLARLAPGDTATVTIPGTGETYNTTVDFIYPLTDAQSREGTARLVLDNPEGKLKIDMFVDVAINASSRERLAVPEEAVMSGGSGTYVIEDIGDGYFRPVMVKTGITAQGMTEILSGIAVGKKIVRTGQFMIDSESNLRGGVAAMESEHAD